MTTAATAAHPASHAGARTAASSRARTTDAALSVLTLNTHRGQGPTLRYVLEYGAPQDRERLRLLHQTRAYAYHIADWLRRAEDRYHVVGLQEVFHGLLGPLQRLWSRRAPQHRYYQTLGGFPDAYVHGVGLPGFRYENVLLSRLPRATTRLLHAHLPGRVFRVAACGFTLVPVTWAGHTIWIGNTHLHAYDPRARAAQARCIAEQIAALGDAPVVFVGDLNTVPPGCKDADFPHGGRELESYKGCLALETLRSVGLRTVEHDDNARFWTHPTGVPNRTLDYILFSRHFDVLDYRVLRDFTLSDHYPVEARLRLVDPGSGP